MQYRITYSKKFRKQIRRLKKSGRFDAAEADKVVNDLSQGKVLDKIYLDHQLTGDMRQYRECHVSNDLLIVYKKDDHLLKIVFSQIGSHSEIF